MALVRRVRRVLSRGARTAGLGALVVACESREVYLVPRVANIEVPETGGAPSTGGGGGGGGTMFPPSGGTAGTSGGAGGGAGGQAPVCEKSRHSKEPRPLGVYIMVDQSSAMLLKWEAVKSALIKFVEGTDQLGKVSVGLNFYAKPQQPFTMPATSPEEQRENLCKPETYVVPTVPILPVEDALVPIDVSLKQNGPDLVKVLLALINALPTESPIGPAIEGAIQGARDWVKANQREERKAVVLLVTDTIPVIEKSPLCQPTRESAVTAAELGLVADAPLVRTYVLNVGGASADLEAVAVAGGTEHAYLSDQGGDLLPALNLIRDSALPCDIAPESEVDVTSNEINVELRNGNNPLETFYRVASAGKCHEGRQDEWYYEVNDGVASVSLCPAACSHARSLADPTIELVYGCPSRTR